MIHRIACDQVQMGMYIHKLGGSWLEHPFWRKKLLLTSAADVEAVRRSGLPYVEIDDILGIAPVRAAPPAARDLARQPPVARPSPLFAAAGKQTTESLRAAERKRAIELVDRSKRVMKRVFESARLGRAIRTSEVAGVVEEVTAAVTRNARTLLGVIRLKSKDEYTYYHSVAVCTLMIHCARHLNLPEAQVQELGLAGLLHDIGKMGLPETILNKPGGLTDEEYDLVRGHPAYGHDLLTGAGGIPDAALDVCLHHHEKIDGSGYPFGLTADRLSLAARLGAICDVYDALTSDRIYKAGWTPEEAVAAMWSWDGHFDRALLFSFMQSIGVFPSGILVRLRSNRLGLVLDNPRRASRPRVCAFYDTRAHSVIPSEIVTVRDDMAGDQIVGVEQPAHWNLPNWDNISERLANGEDVTDLTDAGQRNPS